MSDLRKAAEKALACMEGLQQHLGYRCCATEVEELRAALAAPEQEPVAWMVTAEMQDGSLNTYPLTGRYKDVQDVCDRGEPVPLFATPPRREPLTP